MAGAARLGVRCVACSRPLNTHNSPHPLHAPASCPGRWGPGCSSRCWRWPCMPSRSGYGCLGLQGGGGVGGAAVATKVVWSHKPVTSPHTLHVNTALHVAVHATSRLRHVMMLMGPQRPVQKSGATCITDPTSVRHPKQGHRSCFFLREGFWGNWAVPYHSTLQ
jgi:hypothetical protein